MIGEWGLILLTNVVSMAFVCAGGVVQIFCGAQFYHGAWRQLKIGNSNMDTLVALGSTTAFGYSAWALTAGAADTFISWKPPPYSLISAGHWLEAA